MTGDFLGLLARESLALSAAIAVVLALRGFLRGAFGARIAYAFWLFVPALIAAAALPPRTLFLPLSISAAQQATAVSVSSPTAASFVHPALTPNMIPFDGPLTALCVWSLGALLSAAWLMKSQRRFLTGGLRRIGRALLVADSNDIGPAVIGVVRPRIVLPADFERRYNALERDLVLAHEQAHIRAGDVQLNAFGALLQCLNWFNPLVYIGRAAFRIDQELACDERVMQRHGHARRAYADAMLKTQLAARAIPLGCAWPPAGMKPLKQRIAMLGRAQTSASRRVLGACLCAATVSAGGLVMWIAQPPRVAYAQGVHEQASRFDFGSGRLVQALKQDRSDEARTLIAAHVGVNHWTPGDGTPLIIAAQNGDAETARLLLDAGADVNQAAHGDGNALIAAAGRGDMTLVHMFIAAGADVNAYVNGDETPLINAARENQIEAAQYLIERGADVNLTVDAPTLHGMERRSPLSMAIAGGHDDMVRLLRDHGARS